MALFLALFIVCIGLTDSFDTFPENFIWGASTGAFASEGAWNEDGKSPSIWDHAAHDPNNYVMNNTGGDVACDSYHKYEEDIELLKDLGVSFYRFSIAWSRIIPNPLAGETNAKGVDFYNHLIDALLEAGITPMVFLYFHDMPQILLERYQGWAHEITVDKFAQYADAVFHNFGDRVKYFVTIFDGYRETMFGYWGTYLAPGLGDERLMYRAGHNQIRAHARVWRMYDEKYRATQKGQVGHSISVWWTEPLDPNDPEDVAANERSLRWRPGRYSDPVFKDGDYTEVVKETVSRRSQTLGLAKSLLPEFSDEEKIYNKGASDFIAFGYYSMVKVTPLNDTEPYRRNYTSEFYHDFMDVRFWYDLSWKRSQTISWHSYAPNGFRNSLNWVAKEYGNQPIYVVDHGAPDDEINVSLYDTFRVEYLQEQLKELLAAIQIDGCDVRGYILSSLLDNFKWGNLFGGSYGIYHVDMNHPDRRRTPKMSVEWYKQIVQNNGFAELVPSDSSRMHTSVWMVLMLGTSISFAHFCLHQFKILI